LGSLVCRTAAIAGEGFVFDLDGEAGAWKIMFFIIDFWVSLLSLIKSN
jgi:hypothetical protein